MTVRSSIMHYPMPSWPEGSWQMGMRELGAFSGNYCKKLAAKLTELAQARLCVSAALP